MVLRITLPHVIELESGALINAAIRAMKLGYKGVMYRRLPDPETIVHM